MAYDCMIELWGYLRCPNLRFSVFKMSTKSLGRFQIPRQSSQVVSVIYPLLSSCFPKTFYPQHSKVKMKIFREY